MYTILIADDDVKIRDGLCNIIDWDCLGFTLVSVCSSGKEVLSYLENTPVDVILSDIKMPNVSGLDIAKFIYTNHIPTKMIFISGYREMELAVSAIRYNVKDYILKPVDIKQLLDTLDRVKELLDSEDQMQRQKHIAEFYHDHMNTIMDDFFMDLVFGSSHYSNDEQYRKGLFRLIYPALDYTKVICFRSILKLENLNTFLEEKWHYTSNEFFESLKNFIYAFSSNTDYHLIYKNDNYFMVFGVVKGLPGQSPILSCTHVQEDCTHMCSELNSIFSIQATLFQLEIFEGIHNVLENKSCFVMNNFNTFVLGEQEKMVYSAIFDGSFHLVPNMLKRFFLYIQSCPVPDIRQIVENFLNTVKSSLIESGAEFTDSKLSQENFHDRLSALTAPVKIEEYLTALINDLSIHLKINRKQGIEMVEQVKAYLISKLSEDISLEDVSKKFHFNQYHFSRMFKAKTGENFIDFLTRSRMEKAAMLLKNPNYKIWEICGMVGYQTPSYFVKLFKNYSGCTPSAYRNMALPNLKGGET